MKDTISSNFFRQENTKLDDLITADEVSLTMALNTTTATRPISQGCGNKIMRKILRLCSISADYSVISNVKKHPITLWRTGFAHQIPHLLAGTGILNLLELCP